MHEPRTRQGDLRSFLRAFWLRKWLFLGVFLSIPAAVFAISTQLSEKYEAEVTLQVEATSVDTPLFSDQANLSNSTFNAAIELIQTRAVAREALNEMGEAGDPRALLEQINVEPLTPASGTDSNLLTIRAEADGPERAATIANAFARAVDNVREVSAVREIDQAIEALEEQRNTPEVASDAVALQELSLQVQQLRATRASQQNNTQTVEAAYPPSDAVSPSPFRNTAIAGLFSLMLGLAAVALVDRLDRRIRDPEDVESMIGAPLLSVIPDTAFPGRAPNPGPVRESFQTLQSSLTYFNIDHPLNSILVTSPGRGGGKTTVSTYLAIAHARAGNNTILIDCDMRRPQAASRLGIRAEMGLSDVLIGGATIDEVAARANLKDGNLTVLAAGALPPNPARLLASESFSSTLSGLEERFDIVILDTPPILAVSDAVPLLDRVSGTLLVARLDFTRSDAMTKLSEVASAARATILGAAVTGVRAGGLHGLGYYGYLASGYGDDDAAQSAPIDHERASSSKGSDSPKGFLAKRMQRGQ